MKIKLNVDLWKYKKNDIIEIEAKKGVPVCLYWRKRLKDSEIDNCIEIVKNTIPKPEESNEVVKNTTKNKKNSEAQK